MSRFLAVLLSCMTLVSCDGRVSSIVAGILNLLVGTEDAGRMSVGVPDGTLLEIPASGPDGVIVEYDGYVSSYNQETLIPNWVAYELTGAETEGEEERGDRVFSMDRRVKGRQAMREDYYDSGWTKGHMAPAADFRWSSDAMDDTFHFTNVCPQDEFLNGKDWEYLERQVRVWARQYGRVWVVTGPIVGTNRYGTIGDRGVVVPDSFFKAVLAEKNGKYRAVAFVMGNDDSRYWLDECAMSIDELESMTGIDFFPSLEDDIEDDVESGYREADWGL